MNEGHLGWQCPPVGPSLACPANLLLFPPESVEMFSSCQPPPDAVAAAVARLHHASAAAVAPGTVCAAHAAKLLQPAAAQSWMLSVCGIAGGLAGALAGWTLQPYFQTAPAFSTACLRLKLLFTVS